MLPTSVRYSTRFGGYAAIILEENSHHVIIAYFCMRRKVPDIPKCIDRRAWGEWENWRYLVIVYRSAICNHYRKWDLVAQKQTLDKKRPKINNVFNVKNDRLGCSKTNTEQETTFKKNVVWCVKFAVIQGVPCAKVPWSPLKAVSRPERNPQARGNTKRVHTRQNRMACETRATRDSSKLPDSCIYIYILNTKSNFPVLSTF